MLDWHPHVYAIATRGGWDAAGRFVPMPFVSTAGAEQLFRHQVITLLRDEGLLTEERIELLMSWRHSGFSAHKAVTVPPGDTGGIGRYRLREQANGASLVDGRRFMAHYELQVEKAQRFPAEELAEGMVGFRLVDEVDAADADTADEDTTETPAPVESKKQKPARTAKRKAA